MGERWNFFGGIELPACCLARSPNPFPGSSFLHSRVMTKLDTPNGYRVPCDSCPLRAFPALRDFNAEELAFMNGFKSGELAIEAGTTLLLQGTNSAHLYTVLTGWAFRYKMLSDGRRQILNYALPADLVGRSEERR